MTKRLHTQPKRTPQEIMSENIVREQALKELERAMGKPQVKRWSLAEYQAMIETEREAKHGGWYEGDSQS